MAGRSAGGARAARTVGTSSGLTGDRGAEALASLLDAEPEDRWSVQAVAYAREAARGGAWPWATFGAAEWRALLGEVDARLAANPAARRRLRHGYRA